jgi:hypothetical protein
MRKAKFDFEHREVERLHDLEDRLLRWLEECHGVCYTGKLMITRRRDGAYMARFDMINFPVPDLMITTEAKDEEDFYRYLVCELERKKIWEHTRWFSIESRNGMPEVYGEKT